MATKAIQDTLAQELMVGREVVFQVDKPPAQPVAIVLEVSRLQVNDDRDLPAVRDVSFQLRSGEIWESREWMAIANFGEFVLGHDVAIAHEHQLAITTLADKSRSFVSCVGFPSLKS